MADLTLFAQSNTAARLREAATRRALSHAIILSGTGMRAEAALYAACAHECTAEGERPCLRCANCRKVLAQIHPDVTYVRDEAHRELSAETIRAMRADVVIRPNEGARKVYIFEDCSILNEKDQNILLKTIEEGPPYAAFLFCAENPTVLLPTVRSRCVEVKTAPAEQEDAPADLLRAIELCRAAAEGDSADRAALFTRLDQGKAKISREELGTLIEQVRELFAQALLSLYGQPPQGAAAREIVPVLTRRLTKAQIVGTIDMLGRYRKDCTYNVGVGAVLGGLAAEWEELL